jgi:hypothetical protein
MPLIVLLIVNITILLCWTLIDPLMYKRFEMDGASWSTYGRCVGSSNASNTFLIILCVLNVVVLFLALFQAWKARNISDEFSETKIVGGAVRRSNPCLCYCFTQAQVYSHYSPPPALWLAAAPDSRRTSGIAHFRRQYNRKILSVCGSYLLGFDHTNKEGSGVTKSPC